MLGRLHVPRCHPHRLDKVRSFAIDNSAGRSLNDLPLTDKSWRGESFADDGTGHILQDANFDFDVDQAAELLIAIRPARPMQAHLKSYGSRRKPVDIRTGQIVRRSQREATWSIALNARFSRPSGTATFTSQLCKNRQPSPAGVGRPKSSSRSSSPELKLAATRSSSSRISSDVCCGLSNARLRLMVTGRSSANA